MIPLENLTVGGLLDRTTQRFPDRPAMEYGDNFWTYAELDRLSDLLAAGLLAQGVKKGDHVALWAEAEPNTVLFFYALQKIGAVAVMIGTSFPKAGMTELLRWTDARFLAFGDGYKDIDYIEVSMSLPEDTPCLEGLFYIGMAQQSRLSGEIPSIRQIMQAGAEDMPKLEAAKKQVRCKDTSTILFTSGTTSSPKAVMSSHYSRVNSGIQQAGDLKATEWDRFCSALPFFHCFCISTNLLASVAAGACLYLPESRRTNHILEAFDKKRCTVLNTVPTLVSAMIRRPDFGQFNLSSLRVGIIGGAAYTPSQFLEYQDALGCTLLSSLGQTESTAGITITAIADSPKARSETVGSFMDHVEGKIADLATGKPLTEGEIGEICVRGYVVMQGYYKQPELTAKTIDREGWLHTGDLGWLDGEGRIHLAGRCKELIIRGGENVSPLEVELALMGESGVAECKVVGIPDRHYGEEICACVVPAEGRSCRPEDLRRLAAERLPHYKVPKYICFFEEFPRNETGKIKAKELARLAQEQIERDKDMCAV